MSLVSELYNSFCGAFHCIIITNEVILFDIWKELLSIYLIYVFKWILFYLPFFALPQAGASYYKHVGDSFYKILAAGTPVLSQLRVKENYNSLWPVILEANKPFN